MQKNEALKEKRDKLRLEWRAIRDRRLSLKKNYDKTEAGLQPVIIKKNYKILKKRQKALSKRIKHIEKKIIRKIDG